jgi:hypothetical protein
MLHGYIPKSAYKAVSVQKIMLWMSVWVSQTIFSQDMAVMSHVIGEIAVYDTPDKKTFLKHVGRRVCETRVEARL